MNPFARKICILAETNTVTKNCTNTVQTHTDQKFSVMVWPLIKSFLRRPIFQSKRRNHSGNWGDGGLAGNGGLEGFSRRIFLGATAATGFAFLCTETCPYSGQDAHWPPIFNLLSSCYLPSLTLFNSTSGRRRVSLLPGPSGREVLARWKQVVLFPVSMLTIVQAGSSNDGVSSPLGRIGNWTASCRHPHLPPERCQHDCSVQVKHGGKAQFLEMLQLPVNLLFVETFSQHLRICCF